jgi:ABC-type uncharacterized transport system ATPase subunit
MSPAALATIVNGNGAGKQAFTDLICFGKLTMIVGPKSAGKRWIMEILRGVIHGRTIELEREPRLPEGQEVKVSVEPITCKEEEPLAPGEGIRRSAGGWAEDAEELDKYLDWSRQQRKMSRGGNEQ